MRTEHLTEQATRADLEWWLAKAPTLNWTFAKTMPEYPHSYVVHPRTQGMELADYARAARVIRTFGRPARFKDTPKIYLEHNGERWWTEDERVEDTDLINRAPADRDWGDQELPVVAGHADTFYDRIAWTYDEMWTSPEDEQENAEFRRLVIDHFGHHAPRTLDVGCGTGLLLDLKVTSPALYTGIEPSRAMLNEVWRKHGKRRPRLLHGTALDRLQQTRPQGPYEFVVAGFAAASYLSPSEVVEMNAQARDLLVLMAYERDYVPDYYTDPAERAEVIDRTNAQGEWLRDVFAPRHGAEHHKIGKFDTWVVRK